MNAGLKRKKVRKHGFTMVEYTVALVFFVGASLTPIPTAWQTSAGITPKAGMNVFTFVAEVMKASYKGQSYAYSWPKIPGNVMDFF